MRLACVLAVLAIATSPAHADGVYLSGSVGPGAVRDQLGTAIDHGTFRERTALGLRFGNWALEPFLASESTNPGGEVWDQPTLTSYGIDVKRIFRLSPHVSGYVRGSMSHLAYPTSPPCCFLEPLYIPADALYGYTGRGLGLGVGAQASVRVGGVRAAIFADEGYDYYRLLPPSGDGYEDHVDGSITRLTIGLAVGTDF